MALNGGSWWNPWGSRKSRAQRRSANRLGVILESAEARYGSNKYRRPELELLDAYYERRQYDHLSPWDAAKDHQGEYVPVRHRAPRLNYNFAKTLTQRVTSRLLGAKTFPKLVVPEDRDFEFYLRLIQMASSLQANLLEPCRRSLNTGSCFVRFHLQNGKFVVEHYLAKYCYPRFRADGELEAITIMWVYEDPSDVNDRGEPKEKWYRLDLGEQVDVLYDNPEYEAEQKREEVPFQVVSTAEHGLGFVQGEWLRTTMAMRDVDGPGLTEDITGFIDEINYTLSQSSQAVSYNQDPQLVINGMTEDELEELVRSSQKAWNLGKDGKADFVESDLSGVERAGQFADRIRLGISDIARVVFNDPEKMNMQALSGKAMEIMNAPLVELVDELRPVYGPAVKKLTLKMGAANIAMLERGEPAPVNVPAGWSPKSLDIQEEWPPIFQATMVDLRDKVQVTALATNANLISRASGTRYIAKDFNVEDVDAELAAIEAQPILNPFGAF